MYKAVILLLFAVFVSCDTNRNTTLHATIAEWPDGSMNPVFGSGKINARVFLFMSPECPLCINITQSILQLDSLYSSRGVQFYLVYPGTYYTKNETDEFEHVYNIRLPAVYDVGFDITRVLNATVTPQVVLLNSSGEVVYSGAFDNRAFAPGKKRQVITSHYLEDAIVATLSGKQPSPAVTEPIGCFIEY